MTQQSYPKQNINYLRMMRHPRIHELTRIIDLSTEIRSSKVLPVELNSVTPISIVVGEST